MTAPVRRFRRSFGKFLDASGVNRVASAFKGWAVAGLGVAQSLARIIEPLGAITSVASLAGLYKLTTGWAQFGRQLGFDAQRIGIMPDKLQALQGAAEEAGASAGSMTSGLRTLRDNMVNALGGRDAQSMQYFRQLGISIQGAGGKVRDVTQVLPELADKIAAIKDPTLQARVATQLLGGAGEELLPILRMGAKGMAQYEANARRFGVTNQAGVEAANRFSYSLVQLKLAATGLGYSIAQQVAPSLEPLLKWFTDLISKNREAIAARIGEVVRQFAQWIQSVPWAQVGDDIKSIYDGAEDVAKALGGWQEVAKIAFEAMLLKLFGPTLVQLALITVRAGIAARAIAGIGKAKLNGLSENAAAELASGGRGRMLGRIGRIGGWGALLAALGYTAWEGGSPSLSSHDTILKGGPLDADVGAEAGRVARKYGLDENQFRALLETEHGGKDRVSGAGAFGPAQLMPKTAAGLGVASGVDQPGYNWRDNLDAGGRYFSQLLNQFGGNYQAAEAAYNAGPNNAGVRKFAATGDMSGLPSETKGYVRSIDLHVKVDHAGGSGTNVTVTGGKVNGQPVKPIVRQAMPSAIYPSGM